MARGDGNAGSWWRCVVNAWVTSYTARTDTVRVQCIVNVFGTNMSSYNCSADVYINGVTGSTAVDLGYRAFTAGDTVVHERDFVVNKVDGARTLDCVARFAAGGIGQTSTAHVGVGVGGIIYSKPNPPLNVGWSRVDDTKVTCTWKGNWDNDNLKPWKQVVHAIRRGENGAGWGAWSDQPGGTGAAVLNWDATNYSFTGLKANSRYAFAVYARNQAGDSSHVDSNIIYTTPAAPKALTAEKTGASEVTLTADVSNGYAWSVDFERSADDGATWQTVDTGRTVSAGKVTYVDAQAPAGTIRYRARAFRFIYGDGNTKQGNAGLFSGYTPSNTVTTITPPLAPTITSPARGGVHPVGSTLQVAWTANHPDGSTQQQAQVELLLPSGTLPTVIDLTGDTDVLSRTLPQAGNGTVRVRTKGLHADWGAWSAYVDFTVATPPDVAITAPAGDIDASPFTLSWSVADTTGVSQQRVTIARAGRTVLDQTPAPGLRTLAVTPAQFLPANGDDLVITVTVRGGSTLTGTVSKLVHVAYTPPAAPVVDVTIDPSDLSATYRVTYGTPTKGAPATDHVLVRRIIDGETLLLSDRLGDGQQVIDRLPPLRHGYTVEAVAYAASGAVNASTVPVTIETDRCCLNFGPDAGEALPIGGAFTVTEKNDLATEEYHFATGDQDGLPASYAMRDLDATVSLSSRYDWDDGDLWRRIRRLSRAYAYAWFRNMDGSRLHCRVTMGQKLAADGLTVDFDASLTEIVWKEPAT